jgi:hypothetical protein
MPGGWTIGGIMNSQDLKVKRQSILLENSQDVKIYTSNSNDSDVKRNRRNINKASTLNTDVNTTQAEWNID